MKEINQNYYATIPVTVLCDSRLTDGELRMLMLIVNLVHRYGYCCAENSYLAKISGKEPRTITRVLTSLEEKEYIRREVLRDSKTGKVTERRLYVEFMRPMEPEPDSHPELYSNPDLEPEKTDRNVGTPTDKFVSTPPDKNVGLYKENNIYIHMSEQSPDEHAGQMTTQKAESQPDKKPKKEKPHYEPGSGEYRLAVYLYNLKLQLNPKFKKPDLQQWAHQFHNLMHSKKRAEPITVEDIKYQIEFSQKSKFWRKNIQSAAKLCEQYDRLYDEMSSLEQQGYLKVDEQNNVVMLRDKNRGSWV